VPIEESWLQTDDFHHQTDGEQESKIHHHDELGGLKGEKTDGRVEGVRSACSDWVDLGAQVGQLSRQ
jgi:hypothetical protein